MPVDGSTTATPFSSSFGLGGPTPLPPSPAGRRRAERIWLALLARDRGEVDVCFQFLVYPMLDDRNSTLSSHAISDGRVWNRDANQVGWNAYVADAAGREDVATHAAPARAADLGRLPPAYICVGTMDMFVDEDIAYAQALLAADVPVELHVYPRSVSRIAQLDSRSRALRALERR